MPYIVLDDDETWSTEAYVIPDEALTPEQEERVGECDSKVFKNDEIPRVSVNYMVRVLKLAGMWDEIMGDAKAEMAERNKRDANEG